jgi:hypothetical protein
MTEAHTLYEMDDPESWLDDLCCGENGILVFRELCIDEEDVKEHANKFIMSEFKNKYEIT